MNSSLSPERRSEIMFSNIDPSDCGVIALQAVTGIKRPAAVKLMEKHGYTLAGGTPRETLPAALKDKGYTVKPVTLAGRETPATFAIAHEYGLFLVYVSKHVMALVEGDLHNSKGSWRTPLEGVLEVTPPKRQRQTARRR